MEKEGKILLIFGIIFLIFIEKIMEYGILITPGLVIDGKVVSSGRVVPVKEILKFLN